MIKKVIHVADIHIPNDYSRPYDKMINKFIQDVCNEMEGFEKDEVRIVLVGDIFESKIKATNEAKTVFHNMLNFLNVIAHTIIVAGNHDMLENNKDRIDSISPTFEIVGAYENITYIDKVLEYKSGYIIDDGIIWALFSMHDNFNKPNIDGLKEKYPKHKIIGLFHGEVVGAVTDMGRMSENGLNADYFKDCDAVMAGHIHKHQEIKKNGVPIVYSSSLFQHDFGENTTGHGFVVWDMESMKYKLHEVKNEYKFYKFQISSYDDIKEDKEILINL